MLLGERLQTDRVGVFIAKVTEKEVVSAPETNLSSNAFEFLDMGQLTNEENDLDADDDEDITEFDESDVAGGQTPYLAFQLVIKTTIGTSRTAAATAGAQVGSTATSRNPYRASAFSILPRLRLRVECRLLSLHGNELALH